MYLLPNLLKFALVYQQVVFHSQSAKFIVDLQPKDLLLCGTKPFYLANNAPLYSCWSNNLPVSPGPTIYLNFLLLCQVPPCPLCTGLVQ